MAGSASSIQIQDGGTSRAKASVVTSTADGTKNALVVTNPDGSNLAAQLAGLDIPVHDYISLSYTGSNLTTILYKTGGSGGTTVATLTLAYSGATLTSVTKS